jgi:hypothetical protein
MMQDTVAVVLGLSDAGKDTVFRLLNKRYQVTNIKFSAPSKRALAMYLGVPEEYMENREWRETVIAELGLSPLELMIRIFEHLPKIHPKLGLYHTRREVEAIFHGNQMYRNRLIPVFTDLRNLAEVDYLLSLVSSGVRLILINVVRDGVVPKPSDKYYLRNLAVLEPIADFSHTVVNPGTTEQELLFRLSHSGVLNTFDICYHTPMLSQEG